jgi:hypothetical protein
LGSIAREREVLAVLPGSAVPRHGRHPRLEDRGQQASTSIDSIPAEVWFAAAKWAKDNEVLEKWQRGLAYSLGQLAVRASRASEKQATQGRRLLLEVIGRGFRHDQLNERAVARLRAEDAGP